MYRSLNSASTLFTFHPRQSENIAASAISADALQDLGSNELTFADSNAARAAQNCAAVESRRILMHDNTGIHHMHVIPERASVCAFCIPMR